MPTNYIESSSRIRYVDTYTDINMRTKDRNTSTNRKKTHVQLVEELQGFIE